MGGGQTKQDAFEQQITTNSDFRENLGLTKGNVRQLVRIFEDACGDNEKVMTKLTFAHWLGMQNPDAGPVKRLFEVFDYDDGGTIDLANFVSGVCAYCTLNQTSLARLAFDMYDTMCDGTITENNMELLMVDLYGKNWQSNENANHIMGKIFGRDPMSLSKFEAFTAEYPNLLKHMFGLQTILQECSLGVREWEAIAVRVKHIKDQRALDKRRRLDDVRADPELLAEVRAVIRREELELLKVTGTRAQRQKVDLIGDMSHHPAETAGGLEGLLVSGSKHLQAAAATATLALTAAARDQIEQDTSKVMDALQLLQQEGDKTLGGDNLLADWLDMEYRKHLRQQKQRAPMAGGPASPALDPEDQNPMQSVSGDRARVMQAAAMAMRHNRGQQLLASPANAAPETASHFVHRAPTRVEPVVPPISPLGRMVLGNSAAATADAGETQDSRHRVTMIRVTGLARTPTQQDHPASPQGGPNSPHAGSPPASAPSSPHKKPRTSFMPSVPEGTARPRASMKGNLSESADQSRPSRVSSGTEAVPRPRLSLMRSIPEESRRPGAGFLNSASTSAAVSRTLLLSTKSQGSGRLHALGSARGADGSPPLGEAMESASAVAGAVAARLAERPEAGDLPTAVPEAVHVKPRKSMRAQTWGMATPERAAETRQAVAAISGEGRASMKARQSLHQKRPTLVGGGTSSTSSA